MGIRIHKIMGFGLADLQLDEEGNAIVDSRILPEAAEGELLWDLELPGYRDWLLAQKAASDEPNEWITSDLIYMNLSDRKKSLADERASDYIRLLNGYDGEAYNGKGVLIVRPYAMDDWMRYNSAIDHAEDTFWQLQEFGRYEGPQTRVQELDYAPWPHEGRYWDVRTGNRVKSDDWIFIGNLLSVRRQTPDHAKAVDKIAKNLGYEDYEDAKRWVKPMLPENVKHMLDWSGVLPNAEDYRALRPMILTYWS